MTIEILDNEYNWAGHIYDLLTEKHNLSFGIREELRDHIIRNEADYIIDDRIIEGKEKLIIKMLDDKDPSDIYNQLTRIPPNPKVVEYLVDYCNNYCY
jgi:hypothetical protein